MLLRFLCAYRSFWLLLVGWLSVGYAWPAAAQAQEAAVHTERPATPPAVSIPKLMLEARALQRKYRDSEALAKYEQVIGQAPQHYEALWQAAVLSVRIGVRYTDETRKRAYFESARSYAGRAHEVRPEGGEANYAVALALANQAALSSARRRLLAYKEMKGYVFKAVEQRPNWADAWQLLGRWHYRVDHYNVLERLYSRFFLGGMPSGAGSRKAMAALEQARRLDPKRIQFCYDLARVYRNQRKISRAMAVLEEARQLTPVTSEELEVSRRCANLLQLLYRKHGAHGEDDNTP